MIMLNVIIMYHNNKLKKRAHTGRTSQKNVRPSTEMCAPGAGRTLNFEHCSMCVGRLFIIIISCTIGRTFPVREIVIIKKKKKNLKCPHDCPF